MKLLAELPACPVAINTNTISIACERGHTHHAHGWNEKVAATVSGGGGIVAGLPLGNVVNQLSSGEGWIYGGHITYLIL